MNDEAIIELITQIADKLGTTAEHLWGVMIKQAPIAAATDVTIAILSVVVWILVFRFVKAKTAIPEETEANRSEAEWEDEGAFVAWAVVALTAIITVAAVIIAVTNTITVVLNPEFWALKQLLP